MVVVVRMILFGILAMRVGVVVVVVGGVYRSVMVIQPLRKTRILANISTVPSALRRTLFSSKPLTRLGVMCRK